MKKKILIVEDNKDSREILGLFVTKIGHQVIKASNSKEAITYAEAECPDLIFMDLDLPDVDGIKTTAMLKQNPKTSHIPVVALTAWMSALSEITPVNERSVNEKSDENDDTDLVSFRNVFDELREYTSDLCFLCEELKFAGHSDVTHDEYLKLGEYSPLPPYPDYEPFICNDCLTKIVSPKTTTD